MPQQSSIASKVEFLIDFGSALHNYGLAADRLERALQGLATKLELDLNVFSTPTLLMLSFGKNEGYIQHSVRLSPGDVDLAKISMLDRLGDKILDDKVTVTDAKRILERIIIRSTDYPKVLLVLAFAIVSATASLLFEASIIEMTIACLLGALVGFMSFFISRFTSIARYFEFIAAFIVSLVTHLCFLALPLFNMQIVMLASLIILFPGLSITISMNELATDHLVSGTARLMGALISLFKIAFGLLVPLYMFSKIDLDLNLVYQTEPLAKIFSWLAILIVPFAFVVLFKARFKDAFYIYLTLVSGFSCFDFSYNFFHNIYISAFFSALTVGIAASLYARTFKLPAATLLLPGIILLVPGSMGFKGLSSLIEKNTLDGINTLVDVFMTGIFLVAGLLLANILIPPKRNL